MDDGLLLRDARDGVLTLTLNRPDKRNALNLALTEALVTALDDADGDDGVRAIVLAANGPAFCAGADIREFKDGAPGDAEADGRRTALYTRLNGMIPGLGTPVVAAVGGVAMGGGCAVVLGCDMAVASEDARFGYPELKHGIVPGGVLPSLVRQVGAKAAFDLVGTGRTIDAAEALRFGMINRVVPADRLMAEALATAETLAQYPADAMAATKALVHELVDLPIREGLERVRAAPRP